MKYIVKGFGDRYLKSSGFMTVTWTEDKQAAELFDTKEAAKDAAQYFPDAQIETIAD